MQPIKGKLFSPYEKKVHKTIIKKGFILSYESEIVWERLDATVNKIRADIGFPVKSFRQLIDEVANVTLSNKHYEMYYRGQTTDYKNNQAVFYKNRKPKTTIYPSICRPQKNLDGSLKYSIKKTQIEKRYKELSEMIDLVSERKSYFNEYYYALFQHYGILPTPLIDITQSLRVAATFALRNSDKGFIYVFGLPYPNQSISFYSDLEIVLIKLQNVVPVEARRPRYQEGYLVGKYPIRPTKTNGDDLANRLVAKFAVDNSNGKFWDEYFQPIPDEILYPKNDEVEEYLIKNIKLIIKKKFIIRRMLSKLLVKSEDSKTYAKFCEQVYGKNLTQFNMANMEQINKLIEVLNLDKNSKVLDLGCATGKISEYLADVTNAHFTGIDYVKNAIKRAKKRTLNKSSKLTFQHMDFNNLKFPENSFDAIIAIDTIYFVNNIDKSIRKLKKILKPKGQIAIFFNQRIEANDSKKLLLPNNTKLGIALKKNNLKYISYDFTILDNNHWKKSKEVAEELREEFENEGNSFIYFSRKFESENWLKYVESNRISRYLYYIKI